MSSYGFFYAIWRMARNAGLIVRNEPAESRLAMLLTYARLQLRFLIGVKLLKQPLQKEKLFGFTVRFFSYEVFLFLFEEIFIWRPYSFKATTDRPIIFDCGSNIGMSILYFKQLYPDCVIVGFEPDKKTFELLEENVLRNRLQNVTLFNRAVSDTTETIDFYSDPDLAGSLAMTAKPGRGLKARAQIETTPLSEHLSGEIDFLKMDIEGDEACAIAELSHHNKLKLVKEMVFEYHHHELPERDALSGVLANLEQNGFGYEISALTLSPFERGRFHGMLIYAYQK
ncbi:MAG: FkbM family methyltransferase [Nitrospiraceae bacterium]